MFGHPHRSPGSTDFPLDQLDVKKKLKPKMPDIVVRLNFTAPPAVSSEGTSTGKGYEMVAVTDSDSAPQDLSGSSDGTVGVEMTDVSIN